MRGSDPKQDAMFSYVSPEHRVPAEHPLRPLRAMMDEILKEMSPRLAKLYADTGRPWIYPPERLLRALLLQVLYTVRSERLLMEQLNYNLLFTELWGWTWMKWCGTTRCSKESGTAVERRSGRSFFPARAGTSQAVSVG